LRDEVALWSDNGGKMLAPRHTLYRPEFVAKFLAGVARRERASLQWRVRWVNHQPGVLVSVGNRLAAVLVLDVVAERIAGVRLIANPGKLERLARE
jgi:RNA polymerase sigma-70 factor (ECF subfamily)